MLDITICCSFYERDIGYIENLINKCASYYPVILWDDRSDKSIQLSFPKNVMVLNKDGPNKRVYYAKRQMARACKTEYIWFVDSDDNPLFPKIDLMYDINTFDYKMYDSENNFVYASEAYKWSNKYISGRDNVLSYIDVGALWNKIFRTSIVLEAMTLLPEDLYICCDEDDLLFMAIRKCAKSVNRVIVPIYEYYAYKSRACLSNYTGHLEDYKSIISGLKIAVYAKNEVYTDEEKKIAGFDSWSSCKYYFNKIATSTDENERQEMLKSLKSELGELWITFLKSCKNTLENTDFGFKTLKDENIRPSLDVLVNDGYGHEKVVQYYLYVDEKTGKQTWSQ